MKEITMFYLEGCPHCIKALHLMEQLKIENPHYRDVPIKLIEERREKELADSFDYYYVPTYYVNDSKQHEGAAEIDDIRFVFEEACSR